MNSAKFDWNPNMRFEEADKTELYFLHWAPLSNMLPPQGPNGATLGTVMNNFKFIT